MDQAIGSVTVWGAQLELGSVPTSYIPTLATTMTRSADVASVATANGTWFNSAHGTLQTTFKIPALSTTSHQFVAGFDDGSLNNRMSIKVIANTLNLMMEDVVSGTGGTGATFTSSVTAGTVSTAAYAYQAGNFGYAFNGAVSSTASNTVPTVTSLQLGNSRGTDQFLNGWLQSVKYGNTRLSDAAIQGLSHP